jgi:large repetitive protein
VTLADDGSVRLLRIDTPAGETLRLKASAAKASAGLELFVRYEGLPNSINFDAAYVGFIAATQTALVTTTQAGTYYILVRGNSVPNGGTGVTVSAEFLPFAITDVTPDAVGDGKFVTITVSGAKFAPTAVVRLVRPSFAEFAPVSQTRVNATQLIATFDLTGAVRGLYDVLVINPDGATAIVPYRLQVNPQAPLDVTVGLGGPSEIPFGGNGTYLVSLDNTGNLDLPYVHFTFGIPRVVNPSTGLIPGEALTFASSLGGFPGLAGVPWNPLSTTLNLGGRLLATGAGYDMIVGGKAALSFNVRMYEAIDQLLLEDPGFLESLTPELRQLLSFDFWIMAAATPMTAGEYVAYQRGVAETLRLAVIADSTAPDALRDFAANAGAWADGYLAALAETGRLRPEETPPGASADPRLTGQVRAAAAGLLAMDAGAGTLASGVFSGFFDAVRRWLGETPDAYGSGTVLPTASEFNLGLTHPTQFLTFKVRAGEPDDNVGTVTPGEADLNDLFGLSGANSRRVVLSGPAGAGDARFIPAATPISFSIAYTHDPEAGTALKELRLLQELGPVLDPRRFQLGDLILGNLQIDLPDNRPSFTGEFDFTDTLGFVLQVNAGVDINSGTATWLLRAVDSATGNLVTGLTTGFLRAGQTATAGYSTHAVEAATGTQVTGRARAIAGEATPLDSNEIRYTLDSEAPVTQVSVTTGANNSYRLEWVVADTAGGAGVADSSVYVSIDGGPFTALVRRTTETSFLFTGFEGRAYQFLVLSSDLAGNVEAAPLGLEVPAYGPAVNLGSAVVAADPTPTAPPPTTDPVAAQPANPLFVRALAGLNGVISAGALAPLFTAVRDPFTLSAFATGIPLSGAGIGALAVAVSPDGQTVFFSGGAGRNLLWRFNLAGGAATTANAFAAYDVPIHALTFDASGNLWASTGGLGLVRLDATTGAVAETHGAGVTLGLAFAPADNALFVTTASGIVRFNLATRTFQAFSRERVDGLAVAPDGRLWGTRWPDGGEVVRFNAAASRKPCSS